ncbi:MAG: hypothetical protein J6A77_05040, partial [Lachnospiraceae bacterium]|nr:hypothetical protein [Lachnospiraceae bacterium]
DGLLEQMTDGAGTVTKYQYNQKKQVTGLTVTAADGTVQYRETNTYDRNGSLRTQTIGGAGYGTESLSYTYDELDRLLSETKNGKTTSYTYDSMGNRLTKTADGVTTSYVYDLCNKLLSETTGETVTEYAYDALGNLTAKTEAGGTTTYAYDALNQLSEVVNPDGTWQKNTYDASGIRSMVTENGITTEFMTFNGLVVSGYSKSGEQTEHYYYGNSLVAAEYTVPNVTSEAGYGEDTEGLETSLYYYLKNSHGDVIGLTNNTGTLTETYRYDAFGTLTKIQSLNENGVLAQTDTALSGFLYAGEQYDKVTGLYYLRARQYDTLTGRFTQEDTYLGDGRNLYVYVSGNPLKYVDPSGHGKAGSGDSTLWNVVKGAAVVTTSVVVSAVVEELCPPLGIAMDVMDLTMAIKDKDAFGIVFGVIGFVPLLGTVFKLGGKVAKALVKAAPAVGKLIRKVADAAGPVLKKAGDVISEVSGKVTKKVTEVCSEAATKVKTKASELVDVVKSGASSLMDKAKSAWGKLFKKSDDVVEEVAEGAEKLGQNGSKVTAQPNSSKGFSSKGYNAQQGERTMEGYVRNNANPEISLSTQSAGYNNNNGNVGGVFKRYGANSHGGISPHVHQPQRNVSSDGNIYSSVGSKTANGGVTTPSAKDVKQLYEYLNNSKYQ